MHWRRKWQPTPVFSCLENPRDGRAWWAAVYGVTQSQTRLKRLSSSSRNSDIFYPVCIQISLLILYSYDLKIQDHSLHLVAISCKSPLGVPLPISIFHYINVYLGEFPTIWTCQILFYNNYFQIKHFGNNTT